MSASVTVRRADVISSPTSMSSRYTMAMAGSASPIGRRAVDRSGGRELAMVPSHATPLDELQRDALGGHPREHLGRIRGFGIALGELGPEAKHDLGVAMQHGLALEHDAAQLRVRLAGLDLKRGARVALEVAHLLRFRVGPAPDLTFPHEVPERREVRPPARAARGTY